MLLKKPVIKIELIYFLTQPPDIQLFHWKKKNDPFIQWFIWFVGIKCMKNVRVGFLFKFKK